MTPDVKVFLVTFALAMYPACAIVGFVHSDTSLQHDHDGCVFGAALGCILGSVLIGFVVVGAWRVLS